MRIEQSEIDNDPTPSDIVQRNSAVILVYPRDVTPKMPAFYRARKNWDALFKRFHIDARNYYSMACLLRDLDGPHTWYNVHTGGREDTVGLMVGHRGYLEPFPAPESNNMHLWSSPGLWWGDSYIIEHWVLCDNLSTAQHEEWFRYQESYGTRVERKATQTRFFFAEEDTK